MEFTPLERAVLNWIARHSDDPALRQQLAAATAIARDLTGVGSFTKLCVPPDVPRLGSDVHPPEPLIESPQLEHGAGTILLITDGLADTLELFSHGHDWPDITEWRFQPWSG